VIDPNKGVSRSVLDRLKEESYERTRLQVFEAVQNQLADFRMTWDDLGKKMGWNGKWLREVVGGGNELTLFELNQIAHAFSAEVYVIFRPRYPWIPKT
jgi:hypothetical protein